MDEYNAQSFVCLRDWISSIAHFVIEILFRIAVVKREGITMFTSPKFFFLTLKLSELQTSCKDLKA